MLCIFVCATAHFIHVHPYSRTEKGEDAKKKNWETELSAIIRPSSQMMKIAIGYCKTTSSSTTPPTATYYCLAAGEKKERAVALWVSHTTDTYVYACAQQPARNDPRTLLGTQLPCTSRRQRQRNKCMRVSYYESTRASHYCWVLIYKPRTAASRRKSIVFPCIQSIDEN